MVSNHFGTSSVASLVVIKTLKHFQVSVLKIAFVQGSPAVLEVPATHFLGRSVLQLMIMKNHLMLIFFQSLCTQPLGCLTGAHISRLLLSKGYVIVNCLRQNLAFSRISLSNGTNRVPRGPHQIYMTALKSGRLIPPGTESWTLMSEKLGGNVVLLDNKLGSEKKHLSVENFYHLGSLDQTLHSSSISKLTGIR